LEKAVNGGGAVKSRKRALKGKKKEWARIDVVRGGTIRVVIIE